MFSRIEISHEQLVDKKQNCRTYFILNCLFFSNLPTSWTLRNIVPVHTREMKNKYRMGLWLNSVEGREVKHISIARYPSHTHYQTRWEQIFLHEYVSLPWLREKGYNVANRRHLESRAILRNVPLKIVIFAILGRKRITIFWVTI